ncbi:MAG: pitrilysin family protein [Candidatus Omnitrophota bacterium]
MNRKWCLLLLFLLPACSSHLGAIQSSSLPPEKTSPPVTRKVLDNGLTVILKEVHRTPVVSIMAYLKTGSAHEGKWTGSGISHAMEHMFFKGTEGRGVGEIEKEIRSYGGDINAFTTYDVTGYTLVATKEHYPKALALLADCLTHARLDPDDFAKEKEVILNEIRLNRDNPAWRTQDLLFQNAYREHPYRYPIIGYEFLMASLSHEDLVRYYQEKYIANNAILVMVGDFQTSEALKAVEQSFRDFRRASNPPAPRVVEPRQRSLREIREHAPIQVARLMLGFHTVHVADPDMYPLDVLAILLGKGRSARLIKQVQKKKELVYGIDASHYTPIDPGLLIISAVLEEGKVFDALSEIQREINKIKTGPITEQELKKAKQQVAASFYFSLETVQDQTRDLASNEAAGLDPLFSEDYVRRIASVTADDVRRVAQQYLVDENLTRVVMAPENPQRDVEKVPSLEKRRGAMQKTLLPNGIRVLLQKDPMQPTVSLTAALLGGLRYEEAPQEGISNFVARMLPKGTSSKSEKEISEWIDAQGASFGPFSGQNSVGIRLKVLKGHTAEAVQFLSELIQHPSFPAEEMEKERTLILGEIRAGNDQIFSVAERSLRRALFKQHPYRFYPLGTEESISRIRREELLSFYAKLLAPEQMVVTVFGDIDPEGVLEEVRNNFSRLEGPHMPALKLPPEPPIQETRSVTKQLPKEQALLLVGFHGISLEDKDYYPFEVLTKVVSGGGGKLYSEIRDNRGQAYTLGAYAVWGLDPGYYTFYVATAPQALPEVREALFAEIKRLCQTLVPEDEMERAKESLIGLHQISLETPDDLSFQAALDELYGLGCQHYLEYEANIRAVTAQDLQRIAKTYLNLDQKGVVVILPERSEEKEQQ